MNGSTLSVRIVGALRPTPARGSPQPSMRSRSWRTDRAAPAARSSHRSAVDGSERLTSPKRQHAHRTSLGHRQCTLAHAAQLGRQPYQRNLAERDWRCDQATKRCALTPIPFDCHRSNLDGVSSLLNAPGTPAGPKIETDRRSPIMDTRSQTMNTNRESHSNASSGGSPRPGLSVTMLAVEAGDYAGHRLHHGKASGAPSRCLVRIPVNGTPNRSRTARRERVVPWVGARPWLCSRASCRAGRSGPVVVAATGRFACAECVRSPCADTARSGARTTPQRPSRRVFAQAPEQPHLDSEPGMKRWRNGRRRATAPLACGRSASPIPQGRIRLDIGAHRVGEQLAARTGQARLPAPSFTLCRIVRGETHKNPADVTAAAAANVA